ncbi:amidase domain-containing protein [Streptomyces roseolus]|uniref:amidase domain-containing protein n=1 Tax=Streptomyces roseolus TaxID=67358 RepID=UPI0037A530EA
MRRNTQIRRTVSAALLALAVVGATAPTAQAEEPGTPASAEDTATFTSIAQAYLKKRAEAVTALSAELPPSAPQDVTPDLAEVLEADFTALAEQGRALEGVNGGYSHAEVDLLVDQATVSGGTANVEVTEDTRLHYPDPQPGEPAYEEYSLPHTLTYTKALDGTWVLSADQARVDWTGPAPTTQLTQPIDVPAPDSVPEGDKTAPSGTVNDGLDMPTEEPDPTTGYDYSKMASYADRYWKRANSDYRVYGNDCTNFISQAMRAGGWGTTSGSALSRQDNNKWFYGSYTWTTSYTWAGAENWYWFARKHSKRTRHLSSVWHMGKADVLQADWKGDGTIDHSMIVTTRTANEVYLTYHTPSTHNKKLSTILAQNRDRRTTSWYAHRT